VERGLVDLSEVIPAEVETTETCRKCEDEDTEGVHDWDTYISGRRYVTGWTYFDDPGQPAVSDKE